MNRHQRERVATVGVFIVIAVFLVVTISTEFPFWKALAITAAAFVLTGALIGLITLAERWVERGQP